MLGALPGVRAAEGLVARLRAWDRRTKAVVVAGAAAGLAIAFLLGRVGQGGRQDTAPNPPPIVAVAPPPPVAPAIPTTTAPPVAVETKPAVEKADEEHGRGQATRTRDGRREGREGHGREGRR